jgi:hypothetical protein
MGMMSIDRQRGQIFLSASEQFSGAVFFSSCFSGFTSIGRIWAFLFRTGTIVISSTHLTILLNYA